MLIKKLHGVNLANGAFTRVRNAFTCLRGTTVFVEHTIKSGSNR